jgi:c(7)-type cytochrome triheme protein
MEKAPPPKGFKGSDGMKKAGLGMVVGLLFSLMVSLLAAQPEQVTLDHREAFGKKQRPPVLFPHNRHMEGDLSCKDCHHRYEQGKNILDESELEEGKPGIRCSECHDSKSSLKLREAFHRQCIDCHSILDKAGKKTGPRLCGECHPWREETRGAWWRLFIP